MASIQLPAPTKNAREIALTAAAIISDIAALCGFPFANTLNQAIADLIERRIGQAQALLLEELRREEISVLTDPQKEFFVPSAFRFCQAAREGEAEHNLRLLAKIIAGKLHETHPDPGDFLRISRQLEGLSTSDLAAARAVDDVDQLYSARPDGSSTDSREQQMTERSIPQHFRDIQELGASLALLAGRGLIAPDKNASWDGSLQAYRSTPALKEIIRLASARGAQEA